MDFERGKKIFHDELKHKPCGTNCTLSIRYGMKAVFHSFLFSHLSIRAQKKATKIRLY